MAAQEVSGEPGQALALWLTGLPAAGKTTLAGEIAGALRAGGLAVCVLDGDDMRRGLNADLGFGNSDRDENVRRAAEIARLLLDSGIFVVMALISPFREARQRARTIIGTDRFVEIFVDAPLDVCRERDPKRLYAKAVAGEIKGLTGFDAPYEAPLEPEIHLRSDRGTPRELAERVLRYLSEQQRL